MKCKIIFNAKNVPTFEDFEKAKDYEGQSHYDIVHKICDNQVYLNQSGYLLTSDNDCYKFEYWKPLIVIENSFYSNLTFSFIDKLKPMLKNSLTFDTLRKANIARIPEFKNSKGEPAHSKADGSDWSPADWLGAVLGELGEYANIMKKVKRGDFTFEEAKPLIEKELADAQIYLDILAFRVGVDLAKATENKFNEVSERIGCSLRIENNEVVRKGTEKPKVKTYGETYPKSYNLPSTREAFINKSKEDIDKDLKQIKEGCKIKPKMTDEELKVVKETQENSTKMEKYKSKAKEIANNWIGNNKISNVTRAKIEDLIEKDIIEIRKSIESESGKVSNIELITNAGLMGDDTKLKVDTLIKNDLEEFKKAVEACRIPRQELFIKKIPYSDVGDLMNQMARFKLFKGYLNVYPLNIIREQITDIYSFDFSGIDDGKQYLFYHAKRIFHARENMNLRVVAIAQSNIFEYFSKQLGTKIEGMLINGSKENTKLNPGDLIQFHDDRNVLYNFRLVKSSDKNVEVSLS